MLKKWCLTIMATMLLFPVQAAWSSEMEKELQGLKARIKALETLIADQKGKDTPRKDEDEQEVQHYHSVKSLEDRVKKIESKIDEGLYGELKERLAFSGLVEVEASYEKLDIAAGPHTEMSDIALTTVELGLDANFSNHVKGHVLLLWEEDDTEPVDLDEGFITLGGENVSPFYASIGKMYVPFGYFESHFISDPITLELGETRKSALQTGYKNEWIDFSLAVYNGDIDKINSDDHIENFVIAGRVELPENTLPGMDLKAGASYMRNITDSDGLENEIVSPTGRINCYIGGLSLYMGSSIRNTIHIEAEYMGAVDKFNAGELSFDNGRPVRPRAWNCELALTLTEDLELALKYEGGKDLGDYLPEKQLGGSVIYQLFPNTSIALEYLHGKYENNDKRDLITTQLAFVF